jgi:dTDP-glucose 4,6-dehydratase
MSAIGKGGGAGTGEETVLVIGSNSFSGGDFIDLLLAERSYHVIGVSRSPEKSRIFLAYRDRPDLGRFEFHRIDINRDVEALFDLLERRRPAYIVNFASQSEVAPSWDRPEQWFATNAVAVARLGNHLRAQRWLRRYVHISTPEVYGSCTGRVDEQAPLNPSTPYAASRAAGELMLGTLVKAFGFPLAMTRAANVYGAHQQLHKLIPRTAMYLKLGRKLPLHAGGIHRRSFIHIRDVSRAELAVMERAPTGAVYNLATERTAQVHEIVRMVCNRMKVRFEEATESVGDRVGQDAAYTLDSSRAHSELGWRPSVDLDQGIDEVISWVEREWTGLRDLPLEYVHQA